MRADDQAQCNNESMSMKITGYVSENKMINQYEIVGFYICVNNRAKSLKLQPVHKNLFSNLLCTYDYEK